MIIGKAGLQKGHLQWADVLFACANAGLEGDGQNFFPKYIVITINKL